MGKTIKLKDLVQEGRSIHEKFNKKMNESPFGNAPMANSPIGNLPPEMPHRYTNIKDLIRDYVDARMGEELSWGQNARDAELEVKILEKEIKKMKGNAFFEMVHDLSRLVIYKDEYAGPEDSREIEQDIRELAPKLGISANDYI